MPKHPNKMGTVQITVSTTRPVQLYLERLVLSGLYGKNPAEAAERLISDALKGLVKDGTLGGHFPKRR
jgi:hypothetical protein